MLKKILYFLYVPIFLFIMLLSSTTFVFTKNYEMLRTELQSSIINFSHIVLSTQQISNEINIDQIRILCSQTGGNITFPSGLDTLSPAAPLLCADVGSGNITTIDQLINRSVEIGSDTILQPLDRQKSDISNIAIILYLFVFLLYAVYLVLLYLARHESAAYYAVVTILFLGMLSVILGWTLDFTSKAISAQVLDNVPEQLKSAALQLLLDLRNNILPKIINEAFAITAFFALAPIGAFILYRLTIGKTVKYK